MWNWKIFVSLETRLFESIGWKSKSVMCDVPVIIPIDP
jgi:hypothetical protein